MSFIYIGKNCQKILFDPSIRPYQELPLRIRVDLGVTVMKGYFTLHKAPGLEPHYNFFFFGGARGVMVIVVGNGHDDTSSHPGRD